MSAILNIVSILVEHNLRRKIKMSAFDNATLMTRPDWLSVTEKIWHKS